MFDIKTLALIPIINSFVLGVCCLVISYKNTHKKEAVAMALSCFLTATALSLQLAQGTAPKWLAFYVSNSFSVLSVTAGYYAFGGILGYRIRLKAVFIAIIPFFIIFPWFIYVDFNTNARILIWNIYMLGLHTLILVSSIRVRKNVSRAAYILFAFTLIFYTLALVLRTVFVFSSDKLALVWNRSIISIAILFSLFIFIVFNVLAFIVMISLKFHSGMTESMERYRHLNSRLEEEVRLKTADLNKSLEKLKATHNQLIMTEKMASIGIFTAGIAHELNNPMNYISLSLPSVQSNINKMKKYIRQIEKFVDENGDILPRRSFERLREKNDMEAVEEELPVLLDSLVQGVNKAAGIIRNLKTFSRTDSEKTSLYNINEGIESALLILHHYYSDSNGINVVKKLGQIPEIRCFPQKMGQAFLNIIHNALQAVQTVSDERNKIVTVKTSFSEERNEISVSIEDTGIGMSPDTANQMFDPFFTLKEAGEGTGLGLSIVHSIIREHSGIIEVNSEPDKGTEFIIRLPVK